MKRSIAKVVSSGSRVFSYLALASVRSPNLVADLRIVAPSKLADSSITESVASVISENSPPITPATPVGSLSLHIIRVSASIVRFVPSKVTKSIGLSKVFTLTFDTLSLSNACIG